MINLFWAKRWVSYLLTGVVTTAVFLFMLLSGTGILLSIVVALLANVLMTIISRRFLLAHPLMDYLEGRGLIVKSIDSTGLIRTFLVQLKPPYLQGELDGEKIEDVFDRGAMMYETTPAKVEGVDMGDEIVIRIPKDKYHTMQFSEFVYPVFIWNANLKKFITKDAIAKLEADALLDHALLYLMRKVEELNSHLRDFGRYVMDSTKPTWFNLREFVRKHPVLFILLLVGVIAMFLIMFFPSMFQGFTAPAAEAVKSAAATTPAPNSPIQPAG